MMRPVNSQKLSSYLFLGLAILTFPFLALAASSAPTPSRTPGKSISKAAPHKTQKAKAKGKKGKKLKKSPAKKITPTPARRPTATGSMTAVPSLTATLTPIAATALIGKGPYVPTKPEAPTATLTPGVSRPFTPTPTVAQGGPRKRSLPSITVIPNPARGDKAIFRVMVKSSSRAEIVIYDRFFNKVALLQGEGEQLFDILWSLQKVPEGIYYYQAEIQDKGTGETKMMNMQNFAVEKDADPNQN